LRFCPPERVSAFEWILCCRSQSRNNCSKSSSASELLDHLTARNTLRVWRHDSSGMSTFFWGTMPIVPRGGFATPPSKTTVPRDRPVSPPMTDSEVDLPALNSE
jgi:hypothetical protein